MDHAWMKRSVYKKGDKLYNMLRYNENTARNYSEFDIDKFIKLVKNKLAYNKDI